jgi:hypothetical protein
MMQETEGQKEKIRTLEEEVQYYKSDQTSIREFKTCAKAVRKELHDLDKEM